MACPAAFCDVDRTLVVGTTLESCFLRLALRRGAIGPRALLANLWTGLQALGLLPASPTERLPIPGGLTGLTRLRYAFLSGNKAYLRGLHLDQGRELAQAALEEHVLPHLSRRGREVLAGHRAAGRRIILLTGTLDFLAEPLRAHLGGVLLLAAHPEAHQGVLTGRLAEVHPYGVHKRELLRQLAAAEDLDLAASYAYADHYTDVPFLEAVGHPVAVNADRRLRQVAQERGWETEEW